MADDLLDWSDAGDDIETHELDELARDDEGGDDEREESDGEHVED